MTSSPRACSPRGGHTDTELLFLHDRLSESTSATLPHAVLVYSRPLRDESPDFEGRVSRFDDRVASLEELMGFQSIGVPNRRLIAEWSDTPKGAYARAHESP